jgi:hypothetical protein
LNSEKIQKIYKKIAIGYEKYSWIVKWFGKYRRKLWNDMEIIEENCEKIWKIWKKSKLNSEKIGTIQKKSKLKCEMT